MLCEQTGVQFNVLLAAAEQHHRTMTLIASEASHAIYLEGPGVPSTVPPPEETPGEAAGPGAPIRVPLPDVPEDTDEEAATPLAVNPAVDDAQLQSDTVTTAEASS
jgi:hypothetical protein